MKMPSALQMLAILVSTVHLPAQTPGTLDNTFQAHMPADFAYQLFGPLAVQPDGKIIVGGACNAMAEPGSRFLARLKSDGGLDSSFTPAIRAFSEGWTGDFKSIVAQADGKIVLGGSQWEGVDLNQSGLARLNADGSG